LSSELMPPSGTGVTGIDPLAGGAADGRDGFVGLGGVYTGGAVAVGVTRVFL